MLFRAIQRGMAALILCCACSQYASAQPVQQGGPCHVEVRHERVETGERQRGKEAEQDGGRDGGRDGVRYTLFCDGKPFFIQGAGGDASQQMLKDCGANSLRLWGADKIDATLAQANKLGLKVALGIWLEHQGGPEHFDYHNPKDIARQYQRARDTIIKYKDNPAVLLWGIGNEMEEPRSDDLAIWNAVENIAAMAHKLDRLHPTMTVTAEIGGKKVQFVNRYCPDIDIMGINSYAGAASLAKRYRQAGGVKPYIVTEFGPAGAWECAKTSWGAPIELTSTEKSEAYKTAYEKAVLAEKGKLCLGSYAFVWGNKQETTATWFGMFLADGSHLQSVDTMKQFWTGTPPAHACPKILSAGVDRNQAAPGDTIQAKIDVPASDGCTAQWVLTVDPAVYVTGGVHQDVAAECKGAILHSDVHGAEIKMPDKAGGYWLYSYIRDSHGGAATAVIPLLVKQGSSAAVIGKGKFPLVIYGPDANHSPYAWSGWMGDTTAIKVDPKCTENPHSGSVCMKCQFSANTGFGGVAGQSPANDWGDKPGGLDLTGATKLTFWARGAEGSETVSFKLGILGSDKKYPDSDHAELTDQVLTPDWKQYTIDLNGKNLTCIKTGFVWIVSSQGKPITFYLADVQYE